MLIGTHSISADLDDANRALKEFTVLQTKGLRHENLIHHESCFLDHVRGPYDRFCVCIVCDFKRCYQTLPHSFMLISIY